ncbi:MAG: thioesterase family protein [Acidimicrobiia bacterium]
MDSNSAEWLGLNRVSETEWSFKLAGRLCRPDARLYGGTGLAAMLATMEAQTGRTPLWATVQFVGSAALGEQIDCELEVLANGRRTSQVRFTARVGDREILAGVGSTGIHVDGKVPNTQVPAMPKVPGPESGVPWGSPLARDPQVEDWTYTAEVREVEVDPLRMYMWARMRQGEAIGAAELSFLADIVPPSVLRVVGEHGGGNSLDNSMRFAHLVDTEWVLFEFDPWFIAGGYVHGGVKAWAETGEFLAHGSQTASATIMPKPVG